MNRLANGRSFIVRFFLCLLVAAFFLTTTATAASAGPFKFLKRSKDNYTVKVGGVELKKAKNKPDLNNMYADANSPAGKSNPKATGFVKRNGGYLAVLLLALIAGAAYAISDTDNNENRKPADIVVGPPD
ncbi:MAG: hypothetical protein V3T30_06625 [Thermodesulfobacteriota bacterium]